MMLLLCHWSSGRTRSHGSEHGEVYPLQTHTEETRQHLDWFTFSHWLTVSEFSSHLVKVELDGAGVVRIELLEDPWGGRWIRVRVRFNRTHLRLTRWINLFPGCWAPVDLLTNPNAGYDENMFRSSFYYHILVLLLHIKLYTFILLAH